MLNKIWNKKFKGVFSSIFIAVSLVFEYIGNRFSTFLFKSNIHSAGKCIKVLGKVTYRYPSRIIVGNNVIISKGTVFSSEENNDKELLIGDDVSVGERCLIDFTGGLTIKSRTHISHMVIIYTHSHGDDHHNIPVGSMLSIGENVFVGARTIILSGCTSIGDNSVIGAGSIVTGDIPDNAVVAGCPAKVLRYKQ